MRHIFILNTHAGTKEYSDTLREKLNKIDGFEYFIFTTRSKEKEYPLVKKIAGYFAGEKLRIYCCGGSGTFRNILNSIDNLDNVELAFYPCGMTNDFLKIFKKDETYFKDIMNLVNGTVRKVDYIETNHGRALNTFSIGMDTDTLEGMERYRPFGVISGRIPYFMSIIYSLVGIKNIEYALTFDGVEDINKGYEVFFGNGPYIGGNVKFGLDRLADDGLASVFLGPKVNTFSILPHVLLTTSGKTEETQKFGARLKTAKEMTIRRTDGKAFSMDYDGEMSEPHESYEARIIHKGLNFVVPSDVSYGFVKEDE